MKNYLTILCFFILCWHHAIGRFDDYNQTIIADKANNADLKLSVDDLKLYLERLTGKSFSIKEKSEISFPAIYVKFNSPGILNKDQYVQLQSGTIEDFIIKADESRLFIVANNEIGLCHGIYTYLDMLGVKWYFPGLLWEYVPVRNDIQLSLNKYYSPSFHLRTFFGTGGIAPVASVDPASKLSKVWVDWKRRNRMNGEVSLGGHYGEAFNLKYKQDLQQHPEYLALIGGKRQAWSPSTKLCISNPDVRKLYIEDRVNDARTVLTDKTVVGKITVSVEPSDGDGDCECDQCKKMGSVSDRVFFLANQVASSFEKISPRLFANLYAYNMHAAPPNFSLSPQLIVQIVPYAYQRVSGPEEFIERWNKKSKYLTLYDYYGLPDWHYNIPLSGVWSQEKLVQKIKYWYGQKIKGFTLESSYSIGSTGLGLYLAARTGWDVSTNTEAEKINFYNNLFGNSGAMKVLFQKLNSFQGAPDIPFLLRQLSLAENETKGQFTDRVDQLKAYVHYLILFLNLQNASDKDRPGKWEELMNYVWKIYPTALVQTTRLDELLCNRFSLPQTITNNWDLHSESAIKLQNVSFLTKAELQTLIKQDEKEYPLLKDFPYQTSKKSFRLIAGDAKKENENPNDGLMLLEFPETYVQPNKEGVIQFWLKTNETSANNERQVITIELLDTSNNKVVQSRQMTISKQWTKVTVRIAPSKVYRLDLQNSNWIRFYSGPSQWLAFASIPVHSVMGKLYFQLPAGISAFYYDNASLEQPVFKTKEGPILAARKINDQNLYQVNVSGTASPQVLTMESSEYKYLKFYSVPGLFFMYPNYRLQ
jgi:hypothetical protein